MNKCICIKELSNFSTLCSTYRFEIFQYNDMRHMDNFKVYFDNKSHIFVDRDFFSRHFRTIEQHRDIIINDIIN